MRKTDIVIIPDAKPEDNRDGGKVFLLTEMSAARGEKFAARFLLMLASQGLADRDDAKSGMAGLSGVTTDMLSAIPFDIVEPLLDEMMECVQFVGDRSKIDQLTKLPIARPLIEDDIEEISTRIMLRGRLIDLHTGFSVSAFLSRLGATAKERISTTLTSPEPSAAS